MQCLTAPQCQCHYWHWHSDTALGALPYRALSLPPAAAPNPCLLVWCNGGVVTCWRFCDSLNDPGQTPTHETIIIVVTKGINAKVWSILFLNDDEEGEKNNYLEPVLGGRGILCWHRVFG